MMKPFERIVWHAGEPPAVLQGPPVPLKIGIHEDLVKLATSPATEVRKALRHYCALKPYIAALLVDQAMRYDAAGEPVSEGAQIAAAQLYAVSTRCTKDAGSAGTRACAGGSNVPIGLHSVTLAAELESSEADIGRSSLDPEGCVNPDREGLKNGSAGFCSLLGRSFPPALNTQKSGYLPRHGERGYAPQERAGCYRIYIIIEQRLPQLPSTAGGALA